MRTYVVVVCTSMHSTKNIYIYVGKLSCVESDLPRLTLHYLQASQILCKSEVNYKLSILYCCVTEKPSSLLSFAPLNAPE